MIRAFLVGLLEFFIYLFELFIYDETEKDRRYELIMKAGRGAEPESDKERGTDEPH